MSCYKNEYINSRHISNGCQNKRQHKLRGSYSNYNELNCNPEFKPINKVRTYPHHPIRTFFPDPNRKSYVIENRTDQDQLLSISKESWEMNDDVKFFI